MARLIDEAVRQSTTRSAVMALIGAGYVSREINPHYWMKDGESPRGSCLT